jgi:putative ATP-binding cassette transporter
MSLLGFLWRESRAKLAVATCLGLVGGVTAAGVTAEINHLASDPSASPRVFWALVLGSAGSRFLANQLVMSTSVAATMRLRLMVARRVLGLPFRAQEQIGQGVVSSALVWDAEKLAFTMPAMSTLFASIVTILATLAYVASVSMRAFGVLLGTTLVGGLIFRAVLDRHSRQAAKLRPQQDALFDELRSVNDGAKELRLNRARREAFLTRSLERTLEGLRKSIVNLEGWANIAYQSAWLLLMGLVAATFSGAHWLGFDQPVASLVAFAVLTISFPINAVLGSLTSLADAGVSLRKLEMLGLGEPEPQGAAEEVAPVGRWERLELRGVVHGYRAERDRSFTLGPIDLVLVPGEITFVVGGNGSGKSTLGKLLVGLYAPEEGKILLDGKVIDESRREWYRQHFSAVFADFHLFKDLVEQNEETTQLANQLLRELELDGIVSVKDGAFTTTSLSTGQRKRLALVLACLEDRPILLFDEWAADQDPHFKDVFYRRILPDLKARGKSVVVISHDDRYFSIADQTIKLDSGKQWTESTDSFMVRLTARRS